MPPHPLNIRNADSHVSMLSEYRNRYYYIPWLILCKCFYMGFNRRPATIWRPHCNCHKNGGAVLLIIKDLSTRRMHLEEWHPVDEAYEYAPRH